MKKNCRAKAYSSPKVHKEETPILYRLVVSNPRTKMFRISKWVDSML